MATNSNPQLGAATALVQLLTEYPELRRLDWRVASNGFFAGALAGDLLMREDARPIVAAWRVVLGGTVRENAVTFKGEERCAFHVEARWRDVRVDLHVSCPVSALAETAVAA